MTEDIIEVLKKKEEEVEALLEKTRREAERIKKDAIQKAERFKEEELKKAMAEIEGMKKGFEEKMADRLKEVKESAKKKADELERLTQAHREDALREIIERLLPRQVLP